MKKIIFILTLIAGQILVLSMKTFGQYFEGKLSYMNFYLDKKTFKPLFDGKAESVFLKGDFQKTDMQIKDEGALDWEISDFKKQIIYSHQTRKDAPIAQRQLCTANKDTTSSTFKLLDTTFVIAGLTSKVIIESVNGVKKAEYYFCEDIHINPLQYKCSRSDKLDIFYKKTSGALITQMVQYGDDYTYIYQLQKLDKTTVDDSQFQLPKDLKIVNGQN